nr:MAG TPA: hypothetical protein [Caudoviricetes sp.]
MKIGDCSGKNYKSAWKYFQLPPGYHSIYGGKR